MKPAGTIAVLGTGLLGRAVAERLRAVGYEVTVYNRTAAKALPLQALGITVVATPELAVAQSDQVLLFLSDANAVTSVLLSPACAISLRGKTIVQMSTIGSAESLAVHEQVARLGGSYCEAPVLGSMAEAKAGTLLVMVGATQEQFGRLTPLFRSLGREPRLIGPVGQAATLKLALNHLIAAEIAAFSLSLALIHRDGIAIETFMGLLRDSAIYAPTFDKKLPRIVRRDYRNPNFSIAHMVKDLTLFLQAASASGLATSGVEGIHSLFLEALNRQAPHLDYSAIFEVLAPRPTPEPS